MGVTEICPGWGCGGIHARHRGLVRRRTDSGSYEKVGGFHEIQRQAHGRHASKRYRFIHRPRGPRMVCKACTQEKGAAAVTSVCLGQAGPAGVRPAWRGARNAQVKRRAGSLRWTGAGFWTAMAHRITRLPGNLNEFLTNPLVSEGLGVEGHRAAREPSHSLVFRPAGRAAPLR